MADHIFYPNPEFSNQALIRSLDQYRDLYEKSMYDPDTFGLKWRIELPGIKNGVTFGNLIL